VCQRGAISFEDREAAKYDETEVMARNGCPGSAVREIAREKESVTTNRAVGQSNLRQWPVQIKLVPAKAPYFDGARLLIAANCCAYASGDFHGAFMRDMVTLIGCPKLDGVDYSEKLTEIFTRNNIESVMVTRMEVPCCGGIDKAASDALRRSGKTIPLQVVTLAVNGDVM
jgi:hypothetical protein